MIEQPEEKPIIGVESPRVSARRAPVGPIPRPSDAHRKLAKLLLRDRIPFRTAAVECGFSQNTADNGPAAMRDSTPGFAIALAEESKRIPSPEELKALAVHTLAYDLTKGQSRGLERTIELLGRFKENDWFVKSQDTQIGVLIDLDVSPDKTAEKPINTGEFEDK